MSEQRLPMPLPLRKPCSQCGSTRGECELRGPGYYALCADCGKGQGYFSPKAELGLVQRHVDSDRAQSPSQRARILERANAHCELCGASATERLLHVGHLLSVDDAEKLKMPPEDYNSDENLAAMCEACNLGIGKHTVPLRLAVAIIRARLDGGKAA